MLSPVVEKEINEYYKARNGTAAGVQVVVVGINTDVTSQAKTDNFISSVGFDLVLDDPTWKGYAQFGPGNSASRYVIINGLSDSPSHKQWEVLFNDVYFQPRQPEIIRAVIERVKPPATSTPTITVQPQSQIAVVGATVTLTISASGAAPLTYQWQKNGSPIPNATTASLVLAQVKLSDSGDYSVVVSNSGSSVTSQAVTVKVFEPVRPVLSEARRIDGGGVEFMLSGENGRSYGVEFSTDLISWKRIGTLTVSEAKMVYRHAEAVATVQGFYRAVVE